MYLYVTEKGKQFQEVIPNALCRILGGQTDHGIILAILARGSAVCRS